MGGSDQSPMNILLTGGVGYIGSHAATVLFDAGHTPVLFDNLSNSSRDVIRQLELIFGSRPVFVEGDVRDTELLAKTMTRYKIDAVMHFAGLKAVGESVSFPLDYYHQNVYGSLCLVQAMQLAGIKQLVFSSSATVYGQPTCLPIDESHPTSPTNPYGWSKLHIEQMLSDLATADPTWRIASLRYFNPAGAHQSGLIGESPNGAPNNLMPYIAQVAAGSLPVLRVFGNDYPTRDGTGVRDYIHVMDLAEGHLAALRRIDEQARPYEVFNLGTGRGSSVLEMISAFERACGKRIAYHVCPRRAGDVAEIFAHPGKAKQWLGWQSRRDLDAMCESSWKFQAAHAQRSQQCHD